jgi:hypothetical protein
MREHTGEKGAQREKGDVEEKDTGNARRETKHGARARPPRREHEAAILKE